LCFQFFCIIGPVSCVGVWNRFPNSLCKLEAREMPCIWAGDASTDVMDHVIYWGVDLWLAEMLLSLQAFVRNVIELHDKYLQYVSECFLNHSLFHKVS
jgi:hypothetical protein